MKKQRILLGALVFAVGLIVGALAVVGYFGHYVRNTLRYSLLEHRADWEHRAFQAYSQESPQVAIWALENLADVLRKQAEVLEEDRALIRGDLLLTYARLAIVSQAAKDSPRYQENMSKALALEKELSPDSPNTKEHLLNLVKKLDESAGNNVSVEQRGQPLK
jgi:hypothetical protein